MAYRLASVLTPNDRVLGRPGLQMAEHFCQPGLGGTFPGIKMKIA